MKHLLFTIGLILVVIITINVIGEPYREEDLGYTASDDYYIAGADSGYLSLPPRSESSPPSQTDTQSVATTEILPPDPSGYDEIFRGVFYQKLGGVVNIRARLNDPKVRFFVGHPSSTMTVCSQRDLFGLQVAVNGSGFYAGSGIVDPFGMVDGEIYSTSNKPSITVAITEDNRVVFVQDNGKMPKNTRYAVSGFNRVVLNSEVQPRFYPGHQDYKAGYGTVRPRTLLSTDGQFLTITLFGNPSTVTAAGEYILDAFPGTSDVFNMDGGGSTNGCAQGLGPLVPETGRPVANVFGIYASEP